MMELQDSRYRFPVGNTNDWCGRIVRLIAVVLAMGLCLSQAPPASADKAFEAKFRYDRGAQYFKRAKYQDALNEFLISNRLAPNPGTMTGIASCLEG